MLVIWDNYSLHKCNITLWTLKVILYFFGTMNLSSWSKLVLRIQNLKYYNFEALVKEWKSFLKLYIRDEYFKWSPKGLIKKHMLQEILSTAYIGKVNQSLEPLILVSRCISLTNVDKVIHFRMWWPFLRVSNFLVVCESVPKDDRGPGSGKVHAWLMEEPLQGDTPRENLFQVPWSNRLYGDRLSSGWIGRLKYNKK